MYTLSQTQSLQPYVSHDMMPHGGGGGGGVAVYPVLSYDSEHLRRRLDMLMKSKQSYTSCIDS